MFRLSSPKRSSSGACKKAIRFAVSDKSVRLGEKESERHLFSGLP